MHVHQSCDNVHMCACNTKHNTEFYYSNSAKTIKWPNSLYISDNVWTLFYHFLGDKKCTVRGSVGKAMNIWLIYSEVDI